ncbi:MAG TPA: D-cysteine desulfhydrase family protein [Anaerolineales bacterium]|nr:D-cysteine desulfhydrase family protein [Anaerolineales bacterium]
MKKLPRVPLAHLPTPVEELASLSKFLGGPRLLVKRDDQTGLAFGGNKTRKLEYLVAEAQQHDAKTLVTAGAIQSNHCRQTAAAARRTGKDCVLVLSGEEPDVPEANTYLDTLLGAKIVWTSREERGEQLNQVYQELEAAGRQPFLIPYGGSSPTGAAAYAYALGELIEQGVQADWIVFASSSGGTQAGLVAGKALYAYGGQVLGISIEVPADEVRRIVIDLANNVTKLLDNTKNVTNKDVLVNDDYLGEGYAVMGEAEREAIHLFARHEGLFVDPVYTGRAAAGLIDLVRKRFFKPSDTVLFWHTGGQPALFDSKYLKKLV